MQSARAGHPVPIERPPCGDCSRSGATPCGAMSRYLPWGSGREIVHHVLPPGAEFHFDNLDDQLFLVIMDGWVKTCSVRPDGKLIVFGFYGRGTIIPTETSPDSVFVSALAGTHLCGFPRRFLHRASGDGAAMIWLNEMLMAHALRLRAHIALLCEKQSSRRLLSFLHMLARDAGCATVPADVYLPMSRDDIGSYLHMSSETVSRSFTWLHQHGHLRILNPRSIRLMSPFVPE